MQPHRKGHQSKNKKVQKSIARSQRRAAKAHLKQYTGKVSKRP